jgi:hypothetical protein
VRLTPAAAKLGANRSGYIPATSENRSGRSGNANIVGPARHEIQAGQSTNDGIRHGLDCTRRQVIQRVIVRQSAGSDAVDARVITTTQDSEVGATGDSASMRPLNPTHLILGKGSRDVHDPVGNGTHARKGHEYRFTL